MNRRVFKFFLEILDFKQNFLLIIPKFASYIPKILNFRVVNSLSFSSVFLMRNSSLSNFSFSRFSWGNAMCSCGDLWIFKGAVACTVYYELQKEVYRPGRHMHTTGQTILILTQPFFFNKLFGNAEEGNEQESSTPFFIMYYFCGNSTKAFWEYHKVMNSPTLEKVQGHSLLNIFVEIPKHF